MSSTTPDMTVPRFPPDFLWGAGTASYQVEGGWNEDGRGESIWNRFCHTPGKVNNGDTGDVACDHYHRWPEDIALMQRIGLRAYRFSISWPRVVPAGRGRVNPAGLDFYSRLVDALLAAGIQPCVTLYHWDLPQPLEDLGGWTNRETASALAEFTDVATRRLGDRVKLWATLNEPASCAWAGYGAGVHAPGHQDPVAETTALHHLLLGHGLALPIIRANCPDARAGIVVDIWLRDPASSSPADVAAARRLDGYGNRWLLDALAGRGYPEDVVPARAPKGLDYVRPGDLQTIGAPLDFLGVNYYSRSIERAQDIPESANAPRTEFPTGEYTDMGWEVYPAGLYQVLTRVHREYGFPALYVTENGAAFPDRISPDGKVHDTARCAYLARHFAMAARALAEGVPLRGYFVWSLLDNFEWSAGYSKRFGVTYVDYATQRRILKDSGEWYSRVIRDAA